MPIVHGVSLSPFVRKVRIVLQEKGVAYDLESVMPGSADEGFRKLSPLGKVPVYQDGEFSLPDSSAICAYLDRAYPEPPLYPAAPSPADAPAPPDSDALRAYGRALWFEEYADTRLVDVLNPIFFQRVVQRIVFKQPADESVVARALSDVVPPAFDYLERELPEDGWLVGDAFGIADLSIGAMFVGFRHGGETVDASRWPKLAAYLGRVEARPSVAGLIREEEASLTAF